MRVPLIAGNWKMNKTEAESIALVRILMQRMSEYKGVDVLICPPFTSLSQLHKLLVSSSILLGAQDISDKVSGAYTGEVSPLMAAEFCSHVILGHSERRAYFSESDTLINHKISAAQRYDLIPILCVGEQHEEREQGRTAAVIRHQLQEGLRSIHVEVPEKMVIAYEPVWAIGSGQTASADQTSDLIAKVIRPVLSGMWGEKVARGIKVLYGGSVKPSNASSFFNREEIDGALVGGASLDADQFLGIIDKAL